MSDPHVQTLGYSASLVLQAMTLGHRYGFEIMRVTELPSGTVYPLLRRLEDSELVRSRWEEDVDPSDEGRPRRRYYQVTPQGLEALARARERLAAQGRLFGAAAGDAGRPG